MSRWWFAVAALSSTGFVQQTTQDHTPIAWGDECPILEIGALSPDGPGAGPLHDVLERAIAAWRADGCDELPLAIAREPSSSLIRTELDGHNVVVTRGRDYCGDPANADEELCLSPQALALTTTYSVDSPGDPRDGELLEIDLEINLVHPFADDGSAGFYDLSSTVTHELGHVIGLDHSCSTELGARIFDPAGHEVPACDTVPHGGPAMYPFANTGELRRELSGDERQAICLIYREHAGTCSRPTYRAGMQCASSAPPTSLGLLLVAFALLRRRR